MADDSTTDMANRDQSAAPKVWLDMDQARLDWAYDQSHHATNQQQVLRRRDLASERTRQRLGEPARHRYGASAAEELDCWMPKQSPLATAAGVPAMLFIHGGAWRGGLASNYAFVADPVVQAGCAALIADFLPVTELDGDLIRMTDQVRRAIAWVAKNAASLGIDPSRVHLVGHSSGAHLASAAMAIDWADRFSLARPPIASLTVCSGMYDLRPVSLSARSSYVRFTEAAIEQLSAIRHLKTLNVPLTIAWGSLESPEFQRQGSEYADAAEAAGLDVTRIFAEGYNHFEILETLANPFGLVASALLSQINRATASAG